MPLYDYKCVECGATKEVQRKLAERDKEKVCEERRAHSFPEGSEICSECGIDADTVTCSGCSGFVFHAIVTPSNFNPVAASEWRGGLANGGVHTRTRPQMARRPLKKGMGNQ